MTAGWDHADSNAAAWERTALAALVGRQAASHAACVSKRLPLPAQPPYVKFLHSAADASQCLPQLTRLMSGTAGRTLGCRDAAVTLPPSLCSMHYTAKSAGDVSGPVNAQQNTPGPMCTPNHGSTDRQHQQEPLDMTPSELCSELKPTAQTQCLKSISQRM